MSQAAFIQRVGIPFDGRPAVLNDGAIAERAPTNSFPPSVSTGCRPPRAWDHLELSSASEHGTTLPPVMGPPPGVHQRRSLSRCTRRQRSAIRGAAMAFREVPVFEVREVLRLWLRGKGCARWSVDRGGSQDRPPLRRGGGRVGA